MPTIREKIIDRLTNMTQLPSISETVRRVQEQLSRGPEQASSAAAIGMLIEKDLGLSAKVLKIANSVFYAGRYGQIGDVKQAVARLGIEEVAKICTTVSGMQVFGDAKGFIDMKEFWKHSLGVAIVMRHIADKATLATTYSHNGYVAGMFHDIGILVLDIYFSQAYKSVREIGAQENASLYDIERQILGIDHGEIGSILLKRWRLPEEICESVMWHHMPDSCPEQYRPLAQLIHIANFTCSALGIIEPGDCESQKTSAGAWHDLNLDKVDLNKIADDVEEGIAQSGVFVALTL